jgi:hypothetical protein
MNPFSEYYIQNPSLERRITVLVKGKFTSKWARMKLVHSWAESFGVGFSEYVLSVLTKQAQTKQAQAEQAQAEQTQAEQTQEAIKAYCNIMIASIYNGYNHLMFRTPLARYPNMKTILHDTYGNDELDKAYELSVADPLEHSELIFFKQVERIFEELKLQAKAEDVCMGSVPGGGFIPTPHNFLNNAWALEKFRDMCIPSGEELMRAAYRVR